MPGGAKSGVWAPHGQKEPASGNSRGRKGARTKTSAIRGKTQPASAGAAHRRPRAPHSESARKRDCLDAASSGMTWHTDAPPTSDATMSSVASLTPAASSCARMLAFIAATSAGAGAPSASKCALACSITHLTASSSVAGRSVTSSGSAGAPAAVSCGMCTMVNALTGMLAIGLNWFGVGLAGFVHLDHHVANPAPWVQGSRRKGVPRAPCEPAGPRQEAIPLFTAARRPARCPRPRWWSCAHVKARPSRRPVFLLTAVLAAAALRGRRYLILAPSSFLSPAVAT